MEEEIEEIQAEEEDQIKDKELSIRLSEYVWLIASNYGWTILFVACVLLLIWKKKLESLFLNWQERRRQDAESSYMHKHPDAFLAAQIALDAARLKMQEKMDAAAVKHKENLKKKEEEKRRLILSSNRGNIEEGRTASTNNQVQSNTVKTAQGQKKSKASSSLRGEYNPLMGSSSGSCFRPSGRGGSGGG